MEWREQHPKIERKLATLQKKYSTLQLFNYNFSLGLRLLGRILLRMKCVCALCVCEFIAAFIFHICAAAATTQTRYGIVGIVFLID